MLTSWLEERFDEVTPREFYRCIFPDGELDEKDAMTKGKYTGIVCRMGKDRVYRYTLTNDLDAIDEATRSDDFCICRPLSYAGKAATVENARWLYAIAVDVDKIHTGPGSPVGLVNLWNRHIEAVKRVPKPTFIVSSGSGLHLYYVLDNPMPLYREVAQELQEYKRQLTRLIWHDSIVNIQSVHDIQQEGIYQGFRMPGTVTKGGDRARAFRTGERVSFDYLNSFAWDECKKAREAAKKRHKMGVAEAAIKWPDWYDRRVLRGEARGTWAVNRRVYDWWKEKIRTGAAVGHRYYCCMMLAIYAQKCGRYDEKHNPNPVTQEELERDMYALIEPMECLTDSEDNHFGLDDVQDALEAYQDKWVTYPRAAIEYRTAITIPANKRNGRTQKAHIKLMNYVRDEINGNSNWNRAGNGRKSQFEAVQMWRAAHPDGRKADCIRETGLSKPTVYKHWDPNAPADVAGGAPVTCEAVEAGSEARLRGLAAEIRGLHRETAEAVKVLRLIESIEKMPDGQEKAETWRSFLELYRERWAGLLKIPEE
jgi:hypothetical protein